MAKKATSACCFGIFADFNLFACFENENKPSARRVTLTTVCVKRSYVPQAAGLFSVDPDLVRARGPTP